MSEAKLSVSTREPAVMRPACQAPGTASPVRVVAGRSAALGLAAALSIATAAQADEGGDCVGYGGLDGSLGVAHVTGAERSVFVKDASQAKGCPAATAACRTKAFLVPGNQVITTGVNRDGFSCAAYVGAKGAERSGWLPTTSLTPEAPGAVRPQDWTGSWVRDEAKVTITLGTSGRLSMHGEATYGALDPDRVARGAVNLGEFQADMAPTGAMLAFDVGADRTRPFDKGDGDDCKVRMRRLGPFLLVADNQHCGGMNVSFTGSYRRAP